MTEDDIVDPMKIGQLPLIRQNFPENPQLLANYSRRYLGISRLSLIPQIAQIRDLKDENEFLKAKVAYLEALMELNGTPASGFKKGPVPGHR